MRTSIIALLVSVFTGLCFASQQAPSPDEPPLDDTRLTIHTLVREDIFAGWRSDNMERHERGLRNIDTLLEKRPEAAADLLAWKGGATLFHAVLAHEDGRDDECEALYTEAIDLWKQSREADAKSGGAASVIGGSYALFTDRLPEDKRADAWEACYQSYQVLYGLQKDFADQLPTHMRGELYGGLAQSAHRTGRMDEYEKYRDLIIEAMPKTAYARVALRWKENPEAANTENISCKSCHTAGRLSSKLATLGDE